MTRHRFRPRYHGVAWTAVGIGGALVVVSIALGFLMLPLATGAAGIAIGAAYLASPSWRLAVTTDADGLEVASASRRRFRLAWADVVRVVASPTTHTCFVDGGTPERSLLVPGVGAPAPYDLEDRRALFDAILAHVPADKVTTVESLERAKAEAANAEAANADAAKADAAKADAAEPEATEPDAAKPDDRPAPAPGP